MFYFRIEDGGLGGWGRHWDTPSVLRLGKLLNVGKSSVTHATHRFLILYINLKLKNEQNALKSGLSKMFNNFKSSPDSVFMYVDFKKWVIR